MVSDMNDDGKTVKQLATINKNIETNVPVRKGAMPDFQQDQLQSYDFKINQDCSNVEVKLEQKLEILFEYFMKPKSQSSKDNEKYLNLSEFSQFCITIIKY